MWIHQALDDQRRLAIIIYKQEVWVQGGGEGGRWRTQHGDECPLLVAWSQGVTVGCFQVRSTNPRMPCEGARLLGVKGRGGGRQSLRWRGGEEGRGQGGAHVLHFWKQLKVSWLTAGGRVSSSQPQWNRKKKKQLVKGSEGGWQMEQTEPNGPGSESSYRDRPTNSLLIPLTLWTDRACFFLFVLIFFVIHVCISTVYVFFIVILHDSLMASAERNTEKKREKGGCPVFT